MKKINKILLCAMLLVTILFTSAGGINKSIYAYSRGESVYVGGMSIGITLNLQGLMVVGITDVMTQDGAYRPSMDMDIQCGDIITWASGRQINSFSDFESVLQSFNKELILKIQRGDKTLMSCIMPAFDVKENKYRVGLWLKNTTAGIGTVTFTRENGEMGCLGHPILNSATNEVIKPIDGKLYNCKIVGVTKGVPKKAGELKGMILKSDGEIGEVVDNNKFGLYGIMKKIPKNPTSEKPIIACGRGVAKVGNAKILTTIDENSPKFYDIAIIKTVNQKRPDDKGLVIKVTDKVLLQKTGGIVQGMSGSPIIQDGKLIGAVTHVFISDPTRGYGIYIDWML